MKVFIQKDNDGEWLNVNSFTAAHGFMDRGAEVVPFTETDLWGGRVPLERDAPVHGTVRSVLEALRQLDVRRPEPIDYPVSLERWLGRRVWPTRLDSAIRERPVFVKPYKHKQFPAALILADLVFVPGGTARAAPANPDRDYNLTQELAKINGIDSATPVWASEVVNFVSEWRVFVLRGEIIGAKHYRGETFWAPDRKTIEEMVATWSASDLPPPVAYSLDVGGLRPTYTGSEHELDTHLVEVNDSFALGTYGLAGAPYAQMIEARWAELVA